MPNQYCFVCASDEGIFLDITTNEGKSFAGIFETCLSVKIYEKTPFSNKICYKCAYELGQCNTFIKKYKESREARRKLKKNCCILCMEVATKGHSFDITKDKRLLNDPLQKIQDLFQEDVQKHNHGSILMCLTCRYTLDILFDLKNLFKETAVKLGGVVEKELNNINFNKIKTSVVSRKTTTTESTRIRLSTPSDSESDVSTMTRSKRKQTVNNNKETAKDRNCDRCHTLVKIGDNMYRFHQTGQTVCKVCWSTMDPIVRKSTRKVRRNSDTKLCTVFLEDVLKGSNSKDEKSYKTEKDKKGNVVYVISDDSSEEGASLKNLSSSRIQLKAKKLVTRKSLRCSEKQAVEGKLNREFEEKVNNPKKKLNNKKKRSCSDKEKKFDLRENKASNNKREGQNVERKKSSRSSSEEKVTSEEVPGKKRKISTRQINPTNPTSNQDNKDLLLNDTLRQRKKLRLTNSDSDALSSKTRTNSRLSRSTSSSDSSQSSKEKGKSVETESSEENVRITRNSRLSGNSSLDGGEVNKRKMNLRKKGADTSSDFKSPMRKRLRVISKSTESSNDFNSSEEESFNCPIEDKDDKDDEKSILFNCLECEASFENKLEGLYHQLTHFQRVELKLCRIKMPEKSDSKKIESAGSKSSLDQLDQWTQDKDESISEKPEEGTNFQDNGIIDNKDVNKDNENNRENIVNKNGEIKVITEDKDKATSERKSLLDNLNEGSENDPVDRVTEESNEGETHSSVEQEEQSWTGTDKNKEEKEIEKNSLEEESKEKEETEKSLFEKEEEHNNEEEIDQNTEKQKTKEFPLSPEEKRGGGEVEEKEERGGDEVGEKEEGGREDEENKEADENKEQKTAEKSSFSSSQEKEETEEKEEKEESTNDCSRKNENSNKSSPIRDAVNPKEKPVEEEKQEGNEEEESNKERDCTKRNQNETEENENLVKEILLENESEEKEVESETDIRIVDSESFEDNEKPIRELEVNKVEEEKEGNSIKRNDREAADDTNETKEMNELMTEDINTDTTSPIFESKADKKAEDDEAEQLILPENSNDSKTEAEVTKEVFDLAEAELRNRQNADELELDDTDSETLENISREIHNNIN